MSYFLNPEAEVEQAVGGVGFSVGPFHLSDEAAQTVAELGRGAAQQILL